MTYKFVEETLQYAIKKLFCMQLKCDVSMDENRQMKIKYEIWKASTDLFFEITKKDTYIISYNALCPYSVCDTQY